LDIPPATWNGEEGETKKRKKRICRRNRSKKQRNESRSEKERKIKTDCLASFSTFTDDGDPHRRRGSEEGRKPNQIPCFLGFLTVAREPTRRQWWWRVEQTCRHCLAAPEVCLTLFWIVLGYFVNFKLFNVMFV
jgi:hypothetical protein